MKLSFLNFHSGSLGAGRLFNNGSYSATVYYKGYTKIIKGLEPLHQGLAGPVYPCGRPIGYFALTKGLKAKAVPITH